MPRNGDSRFFNFGPAVQSDFGNLKPDSCSMTCYGVYSDPAERERNPCDLPCCLAVACNPVQPVAGLSSDSCFLSPMNPMT